MSVWLITRPQSFSLVSRVLSCGLTKPGKESLGKSVSCGETKLKFVRLFLSRPKVSTCVSPQMMPKQNFPFSSNSCCLPKHYNHLGTLAYLRYPPHNVVYMPYSLCVVFPKHYNHTGTLAYTFSCHHSGILYAFSSSCLMVS